MRVHNTVLRDQGLSLEDFQQAGHGSAFITREDEVVVLTVERAGLSALPDKIHQLVDKGFHTILLDLAPLLEIDQEAVKLFVKSKHVLEAWDGRLFLCGLSSEGRDFLSSVGAEGEFEIYNKVESAVADLGERANPVLSAPAQQNGAGPLVVKEILIQASELARLGWQIERILGDGVRHVTVRLHATRRLTDGDIDFLVGARDRLKRADGQLCLAALPQDVELWLRAHGHDKEFEIAADAEQAEARHREHAAGEVRPAERSLELVEFDESRALVACGDGEPVAHLIAITHLDLWDIPSLEACLKSLAEEGVQELLIEGDPSREIGRDIGDVFRAASAAAKAEGLRLGFFDLSRSEEKLLRIYGLASHARLFESREEGLLAAGDRLREEDGSDALELIFKPVEIPTAATLQESRSSGDFAASVVEQVLDRVLTPSEDGSVTPELEAALLAKEGMACERDLERERNALLRAELEQLRSALGAQEELAREGDEEAAKAARWVAELEAERQKSAAAAERQAELEAELKETQTALTLIHAELSEERARSAELTFELDGLRAQSSSAIPLDEPGAGESAEESARLTELEEALFAAQGQANAAAQSATKLQIELDHAQESVGRSAQLEELGRALEQELDEAQARIAELEASLASRGDQESLPEEAAELRELLDRSEEEKVRILADAQIEIERLTREQDALREELESAGEMIERLGKELELS